MWTSTMLEQYVTTNSRYNFLTYDFFPFREVPPIGTPCLSNPHSEYRKGCPRKRNIIVNADNIRLSKCGHQPC